jgi:predicted ATPase
MIKKIGIKNFRTHRDTEIELGPLTLFIGSNNAGKTNLFSAIRHFSSLVAFARPDCENDHAAAASPEKPRAKPKRRLLPKNFFPHRHRLAADDEPMTFFCEWAEKAGHCSYSLQLDGNESLPEKVGCRERIELRLTKSESSRFVESGWDRPLDWPGLRTQLQSSDLPEPERGLASRFFRDLSQCYTYHLQPSFLKRPPDPPAGWDSERGIRIASDLGVEGGGLQWLLREVAKKEPRTFDTFVTFMQRFEESFRGVRHDERRGELFWEFDIGREPPGREQFRAEVVSDGLLRAAAVALLCAMHYPPTLILLEEIEDGISQRNIARFLGWLRRAAGKIDAMDKGYRTQFLVTSHSPSVLRDFSDHLDDAYSIRLDPKRYQSIVTNLNASLGYLVELGGAAGDISVREDGKKIVSIPPFELVELWYRGTIGGER